MCLPSRSVIVKCSPAQSSLIFKPGKQSLSLVSHPSLPPPGSLVSFSMSSPRAIAQKTFELEAMVHRAYLVWCQRD